MLFHNLGPANQTFKPIQHSEYVFSPHFKCAHLRTNFNNRVKRTLKPHVCQNATVNTHFIPCTVRVNLTTCVHQVDISCDRWLCTVLFGSFPSFASLIYSIAQVYSQCCCLCFIQHKTVVLYLSQRTVPLLVIWQFSQTNSCSIAIKDSISGVHLSDTVKKMEHGVEIRHTVKV